MQLTYYTRTPRAVRIRSGPYVYANEVEAANDGMAAGEWYARSSKDNCSLGLKQCGTGLVPDSCGVCVPFEAPASVRNQQCMGCDGVASVFSFQNGARQAGGLTRDRCGVCGGNDCSCVDCRGVVGGSARDDRCGICEGNNTCLDCAGIPYGVTVVDIGPGSRRSRRTGRQGSSTSVIVILLHKSSAWPFLSPLFLQLLDLLQNEVATVPEINAADDPLLDRVLCEARGGTPGDCINPDVARSAAVRLSVSALLP